LSNDERLQMVFSSVFGEHLSPLGDKDGLNSTQGWDSVGQLNVIMAIEAEFELEFENDEMIELTNVAAIRYRLANT